MTKRLLSEGDSDCAVMRYLFEKHGRFPKEYTDLDDYSKGVIFAFVEDIAEKAEADRKKMEQQSSRIKSSSRR